MREIEIPPEHQYPFKKVLENVLQVLKVQVQQNNYGMGLLILLYYLHLLTHWFKQMNFFKLD